MAVSIMNLIRALVSQLRETQALACGGGGGGGDGVRTKTDNIPEISNFGDIICTYNFFIFCFVTNLLYFILITDIYLFNCTSTIFIYIYIHLAYNYYSYTLK